MRRERRMSAFCAGGNEDLEEENMLATKRKRASANRMGRIVNVCKKESRHRINPKPIILKEHRSVSQSIRITNESTHLLHRQWYTQEIAHSLPFQLLVRVKISGEQLLAKVLPQGERRLVGLCHG